MKSFKESTSRNIPLSGAILQAKTNDFRRLIGIEDFECSECWIKRLNIIPNKTSTAPVDDDV